MSACDGRRERDCPCVCHEGPRAEQHFDQSCEDFQREGELGRMFLSAIFGPPAPAPSTEETPTDDA